MRVWIALLCLVELGLAFTRVPLTRTGRLTSPARLMAVKSREVEQFIGLLPSLAQVEDLFPKEGSGLLNRETFGEAIQNITPPDSPALSVTTPQTRTRECTPTPTPSRTHVRARVGDAYACVFTQPDPGRLKL